MNQAHKIQHLIREHRRLVKKQLEVEKQVQQLTKDCLPKIVEFNQRMKDTDESLERLRQEIMAHDRTMHEFVEELRK
jgi:formyltetrahydrofolate synthetase